MKSDFRYQYSELWNVYREHTDQKIRRKNNTMTINHVALLVSLKDMDLQSFENINAL